MGHGEGSGDGSGEDTGTNVAIGGGVAAGLTVFMCVCGIPMIIAGVVFIQIGEGVFELVGIILISIAALLLVVGVIFIILICTGVFGSNNSVQPQAGTVVVGGAVVQGAYGQPQGQPPHAYGQSGPPAYGQSAPPAYGQAAGPSQSQSQEPLPGQIAAPPPEKMYGTTQSADQP